MTAMAMILWISMGVLVISLLLSLFRLVKGPTALDRAVALDVFAAGILGLVVVLIVVRERGDLAALLIVFVLTAFFSTVTVSRFIRFGVQRNAGHRLVVKPESQVGHRRHRLGNEEDEQ